MPETQIPVCDQRGKLVRMLDMGWKAHMVGVEYDGDGHPTDRSRYIKDMRSMPILRRMGWDVMQVIKEDRPDDIVARARAVLIARG